MKRIRQVAGPVYLVSVLLVLFPVADALINVWPLRGGLVSWRFGAAGVFSGALLSPTLGMVVAFVVAMLMEHRIVARLVSILALIASIVLLGATFMFVLDALQVRAGVPAEAKTQFMVVSASALAKIVLTTVVTTVLAIVAWKSSRKSDRRSAGRPRGTQGQSVLLRGGAD